MKIVRVESWKESVPLLRPYTITRGTKDAVDLFFLRLIADGPQVGLGSASPAIGVTGESAEACAAALEQRAPELVGRDPRHLGALTAWAGAALAETPAARAAVDMALHDLIGQRLGVAVVDLLGQRIEPLPTSMTIGILPPDEALAEARDHVGRGFRCLKVKLGLNYDEDVERLRMLRRNLARGLRIRVDANEGYTAEQTRRFAPLLDELGIELLEQPIAASKLPDIRILPDALRQKMALDESVHDEADALQLAQAPAACGTLVIKLMKSGGIATARGISRIAEAAGRSLMWGCMDESVISIAAALHAAYASPATRFLDLDGSFDLARDPATGGFALVDGTLRIEAESGLGVRLRD